MRLFVGSDVAYGSYLRGYNVFSFGPSLYANVYLQPLVGGSGGGGGSSSPTDYGGSGGAGGGAILIASSRDITISGAVVARGGAPWGSNASHCGYGSGGEIRLVADRISGAGRLDAGGFISRLDGQVRLEGYYRAFAGTVVPARIDSAPVPTQRFGEGNVALTIASVAGVNVPQPPTGNTQSPDVIFSSAGPISVTVQGAGLPDGTPVVLRVTATGQFITATTNLLSGNAVFGGIQVPKGVGTIQASANYTLSAQ